MATPGSRPSSHSSRVARPAFVALALVSLAASAGALLRAQAAQQSSGGQGAGQEAGQRPTFRVEANLVRVDAIVTKDGQPVRDLAAADFEVLEDGVPQKLSSFERVDITETRLTTAPGREPSTAAESRTTAEDPRARVFVVFLDRYHTGVAGSHRMQRALGTLLERVIGPDDLVAVMIPDMSASDIAFTRRTGPITEHARKELDVGCSRPDRREGPGRTAVRELLSRPGRPRCDRAAGVERSHAAGRNAGGHVRGRACAREDPSRRR